MRSSKSPRERYYVGIEAIDELIDVFSITPNPQRQQNQPAGLPALAPRSGLHDIRPPVIELTGVSPGSGKTQILHHIVAFQLLPKAYKHTFLGGKEAAVALLDLSSTYSILRLEAILQGQVDRYFSILDDSYTVRESLIHDSLQHLHIFRPQHQQSLLATVDALPTSFLSDTTSHYSANRPLGAIVIHNLSAFFWQDRQDAEAQKDAALEEQNVPAVDSGDNLFLTRYRALVDSLRRVQKLFDCPIVATNWALASPVRSQNGSSLRPHLPGNWNRFRTVNIVLQRNPVSKFGSVMSVEEVLAEKEQRREAVDRSGFSGWMNWWDSGIWIEEIKMAVKAWGKHGGLRYDVTSGGLTFDEHE